MSHKYHFWQRKKASLAKLKLKLAFRCSLTVNAAGNETGAAADTEADAAVDTAAGPVAGTEADAAVDTAAGPVAGTEFDTIA
ncbi:MAG: hypothetical protein WC643_03580 [Parcubacteria group bacterium]